MKLSCLATMSSASLLHAFGNIAISAGTSRKTQWEVKTECKLSFWMADGQPDTILMPWLRLTGSPAELLNLKLATGTFPALQAPPTEPPSPCSCDCVLTHTAPPPCAPWLKAGHTSFSSFELGLSYRTHTRRGLWRQSEVSWRSAGIVKMAKDDTGETWTLILLYIW